MASLDVPQKRSPCAFCRIGRSSSTVVGIIRLIVVVLLKTLFSVVYKALCSLLILVSVFFLIVLLPSFLFLILRPFSVSLFSPTIFFFSIFLFSHTFVLRFFVYASFDMSRIARCNMQGDPPFSVVQYIDDIRHRLDAWWHSVCSRYVSVRSCSSTTSLSYVALHYCSLTTFRSNPLR